jgi:hydroxymethylglutaryl-CoA reductase
MTTSRIQGFYKLNRGERLDHLRSFSKLPSDQARLLGQDGALPFEIADLFIENAVGSYPLPMGVATNFRVNGRDYLVPMAVEESSVVAATSNAAKWIYESGGFATETVSSLMIGQIQVLDVPVARFDEIVERLQGATPELLRVANETHPRLLMRGGGARDIEVRAFPEAEIPFLVVHVHLDCRDAMGANLVNTVCERLGTEIERLTEARVGLRILSNLADRRVYRARCRVNPELLTIKDGPLTGPQVARRIHEAFVFADTDPYRAATHNKGIMNGVDPVVIATGNDWRAVEAGVHAYAAQTGRYRSLSRWTVDNDGWLAGELTIPLQLGTVGGVTRLHPLAQVSLQVLGNPGADELGEIIACSGLAANLAALRALTTTGIQRGHMKLHAKNLAMAAGARGEEIEVVSAQMVRAGKVSASAAETFLVEARKTNGQDATQRSGQTDSLR